MKLKGMLLALAIAGLAACDGNDDGGGFDCGFETCGGDPVGAWQLVDSCYEGVFAPPEECPEMTIVATFDATGTVVFNADMTTATELSFHTTARSQVPASCLPSGISCDQLDIPDEGLDCTTAGDGCDCVQDSSGDAVTTTGTWSVSGNTLTLSEDGGGDPDTAEFCVTGDTMRMRVSSDVDAPELGFLMTR